MSSTMFFFLFIPVLALILLAVNFIFAPHNPYQEKDSAFECGFSSFLGQNRTQFSISFFIFALLFLLFDLEILLVYPYLVSAYTNEIYGLVILLVFLLALTLGFAFELGKKALSIDSRQTPKTVKYENTNVSFVFSGSRSGCRLDTRAGKRSYSTKTKASEVKQSPSPEVIGIWSFDFLKSLVKDLASALVCFTALRIFTLFACHYLSPFIGIFTLLGYLLLYFVYPGTDDGCSDDWPVSEEVMRCCNADIENISYGSAKAKATDLPYNVTAKLSKAVPDMSHLPPHKHIVISGTDGLNSHYVKSMINNVLGSGKYGCYIEVVDKADYKEFISDMFSEVLVCEGSEERLTADFSYCIDEAQDWEVWELDIIFRFWPIDDDLGLYGSNIGRSIIG